VILPPLPAALPQSGATGHLSPPAEPALQEDLHFIKSPIVGTFYASPNPDAPAFVKPGDVVDAGQVLCIIEAMKLMNEIECDVAGEIVKCYVANSQPVEYGERLFSLRPMRKK
jgi:acetyl-CoA carboxylase biotin carboxyl carrier protein